MQPDRLRLQKVAQWLRDGRDSNRAQVSLGRPPSWRALLRQRREASRA
jgi:hypothetical protein